MRGTAAGGSILIGVIAATPALAQAQAPAAQPATWEVKVEPADCSLSRTLASEAGPVTLSVQTVPGSDSWRVAFTGKELPKGANAVFFPLTLQLGERRFEETARKVSLSGGVEAIVAQGVDADFAAAFAGAKEVRATWRSGSLGPFPLPRAKAAIAALRNCLRDQLVEWGADPAQFEAGGTLPVALQSRDNFVPNAQLRKLLPGSEGEVKGLFKLGIATDGSIDSCARVGPAAKASDDKTICGELMSKRLFTPAAAPDGKPVRGAATYSFHLVSRIEPA